VRAPSISNWARLHALRFFFQPVTLSRPDEATAPLTLRAGKAEGREDAGGLVRDWTEDSQDVWKGRLPGRNRKDEVQGTEAERPAMYWTAGLRAPKKSSWPLIEGCRGGHRFFPERHAACALEAKARGAKRSLCNAFTRCYWSLLLRIWFLCIRSGRGLGCSRVP